MDTITHGIAGALVGKGFFSRRAAQVAVFAATIGAMFPDIDVVAQIFSRDPLSIVKYHRVVTHSFFVLPVFAALLAWLTRAGVGFLKDRYSQFSHLESPSWPMLTLIYGIGIASHILLDGMTSFGTQMWYPLSRQRVAWDILFIIDFCFTALVLLPQIVGWIYSRRESAARRAIILWLIFALASVVVWKIADAVGFPFHRWIAALASLIIALLFFLPMYRGAGFRITTPAWCRAGTYLTVIYLIACGFAHHVALVKAQAYATTNHLNVERIAALPLPPSFLDWGDVIRANNGVYQARFDLRSTAAQPNFWFRADSPPDAFISRALQLPEVQTYWNFARFPIIRSFAEDGQHFVDFDENRFVTRRTHGPAPFSYRVIFDLEGNPVEEGWQADGLDVRRMIKILPARAGNPR
ncbi:MAG TPA: metal-dependent hydrolase [Candidatus Acidoferrales bacterium]